LCEQVKIIISVLLKIRIATWAGLMGLPRTTQEIAAEMPVSKPLLRAGGCMGVPRRVARAGGRSIFIKNKRNN
jgi:hypothetical protein